MKGHRRNLTRTLLRAMQAGPIPTRCRSRHPGASKSDDAAIRRRERAIVEARDGNCSAFFRDLLTPSQRAKIEFSFDWCIVNGDRDPKVMTQIALNLAKRFVRDHPETDDVDDADALVRLMERYPAHVMALADECVSTFSQRYGIAS